MRTRGGCQAARMLGPGFLSSHLGAGWRMCLSPRAATQTLGLRVPGGGASALQASAGRSGPDEAWATGTEWGWTSTPLRVSPCLLEPMTLAVSEVIHLPLMHLGFRSDGP